MPQELNMEKWMAHAGVFISSVMVETGNTASNRENFFALYNKEHEDTGNPHELANGRNNDTFFHGVSRFVAACKENKMKLLIMSDEEAEEDGSIEKLHQTKEQVLRDLASLGKSVESVLDEKQDVLSAVDQQIRRLSKKKREGQEAERSNH